MRPLEHRLRRSRPERPKLADPSVRVNHDRTANSQFLPKISLDPTTGNIAVVWYDSRNDLGAGGPGDTDGIPNDDAQFWGAFSTAGTLAGAADGSSPAGATSVCAG